MFVFICSSQSVGRSFVRSVSWTDWTRTKMVKPRRADQKSRRIEEAKRKGERKRERERETVVS